MKVPTQSASGSDLSLQRFVVTPSQVGLRLDCVVATLAATTRSHSKLLIDRQRVRVAGQWRKAGYLLRADDTIEVLPMLRPAGKALPEAIPLDILYEDDCLAAINKPAGMVVHPAPGCWHGTVVNALLSHWGWSAESDALRPGIVHRLDKDTSGVLLIAKNEMILEGLALQFKERQVRKTYIAVVHGRFASAAGKIELPIGRHPVDRKKMSVQSRRGRAAVSRYQVVAETEGLSFVRLFPQTGRTHQLRVHLAAVGHPIVGDQVYGSRTSSSGLVLAARRFPRQALHAEAIEFEHPVRGVSVAISAPYPEDLVELLKALVFPLSSVGTTVCSPL